MERTTCLYPRSFVPRPPRQLIIHYFATCLYNAKAPMRRGFRIISGLFSDSIRHCVEAIVSLSGLIGCRNVPAGLVSVGFVDQPACCRCRTGPATASADLCSG